MTQAASLSANQRAVLADLWRAAGCDPTRESEMLAWCDRQYQAGAAKLPELVDVDEDTLCNSKEALAEMQPVAFRALVDILTRSKTQQRQAEAGLKWLFKRLLLCPGVSPSVTASDWPN
ncbi:MAG TPA: hypothetical protein VFW56_09610 [Bradyrhizobium sp.]|nr:hypothetical protein [Bradyrhizobium sp.]